MVSEDPAQEVSTEVEQAAVAAVQLVRHILDPEEAAEDILQLRMEVLFLYKPAVEAAAAPVALVMEEPEVELLA